MKFKSLFLMFFSFIISVNSFSSISNNEVSVKASKDVIGDGLNQSSDEIRSLDFSKELEKDLEDDLVKYITINRPAINYEASVFYAADYFYLGANAAGANEYSLMRAKINLGSTVSQNSLEFVPLSPQQTYLNGIKENDKPVTKDNPIYNKKIDKLTLQVQNPVLTLKDPTTVDGTAFGAYKVVCLVGDLNGGTSVKTNVAEINDAAGATTDGVVGLAASTNKIFAAVEQNGGNFGSGDGGFAVLIQEDSKLKPIDAVNGLTAGNLPVKLNILADQLFAITQDAGTDVTLGDMYWDANLQRLFIGLVDAHRNNIANPGGAVSVLVGRLDGEKLIIESVVSLNANLFTVNSLDHVLGFYNTNATDVYTNCYKIKTMKTSTGKNYLIFNGIANNLDQKNWIFAFPIVGTAQSDGTTTAVENVGKIAAKTDVNHDTVVQNLAGMHLSTDVATKVGRGDLPILDTVKIEDMFVVNDSVFACVAESRGNLDKEAGIFRSTALFDNNGNIRAWSPWQRVMGTVDKTYGAGFDISTGNYWYFTDDAGTKNTVKVTQWGKSSARTGLMGNGLLDILSDEFIQENAGVHQVFNFDEYTPSIARNDVVNQMSFMTSLGYKKVALIETGSGADLGLGNKIFTPTQNQFVKDTNVFIIQDDALNDLGPICCAEVSRQPVDDFGWLFVAGYNGVAVWRNPANGDGWDGQVGSGKVNFSDLITNDSFSFKEIGDFSQVRKLICDSDLGFAFVMTVDNIYRFLMAENKFDNAVTALLDEKRITPPPGYLLDMIIFNQDGANNTFLLVATTQGLFYSSAIVPADQIQAPTWTRVTLNSGAGLSNPVTHLSFIDVQKGGYTTDGNLYALSADLSLNLATIYRFDIQNGNINPIPEVAGTDYFYSIGELRTNFLTDGALGYSMLSKHFGKTEFLRRIRMISEQTTIRRFENAANLDLESSAHNVGVMVQNTASGGWVVPGDWGIRVNE